MGQFLELNNFNEKQIRGLICEVFSGEKWAEVFLNDSHHGFVHGNQVRLGCLKLVEQLDVEEKSQLVDEGRRISQDEPYLVALLCVQIAALFHDCGRFNDSGKIIPEEQKSHQIVSAKRAKKFCEFLDLSILFPYIEEAILCHDFQSKNVTPHLSSPKIIIGKLVQSSDQMGWFHPDSVYRTLDYNGALGRPFYDSSASLGERLAWRPSTPSKDALTVMLNQLFGPTGLDRFGIRAARDKVQIYMEKLEENILKVAEEHGVKDEVANLIQEFRNIKC